MIYRWVGVGLYISVAFWFPAWWCLPFYLVLSVPFYLVFRFLDLIELLVLWQGRRLIQLVFVHTPDLTLRWSGWKFITSV